MFKSSHLIVFLVLLAALFASLLDFPPDEIFGWPISFLPRLPFFLGLDLQGGTHLVYEADLSKIPAENHVEAMEGLRDVVERRVNFFGVTEPLVQTEEAGGGRRLIVELAGIKDVNQAIQMIGQTPLLEFREVRPEEETSRILEQQKAGQTVGEDPYFQQTPLTGQYLKRAKIDFDQTTYKSLISIEFNEDGSRLFEEITARNVGRPLAIYIDNMLISSPVVQEKISGGRAQITGDFTIEEAKALARNLNAGALPVPIKLLSQQTVGPSLGAASLAQSLKAGVIGSLAVVIFILIFYRLLGLIATLALVAYLLLLIAILKLIPVTLTIAGIGGVVLSVGMAVDANILIFSRMREEFAAGKTFSQVVAEGFSRAWPSIRDGNFTTLIIALILFYFGTSFVKGFALTLSLGIVLSIFAAMVFTRHLLKLFEGTRLANWRWLWR